MDEGEEEKRLLLLRSWYDGHLASISNGEPVYVNEAWERVNL